MWMSAEDLWIKWNSYLLFLLKALYTVHIFHHGFENANSIANANTIKIDI